MDALNSYPICSLMALMTFLLVSIQNLSVKRSFPTPRSARAQTALCGNLQKHSVQAKAPLLVSEQRGFSSGDVLLSHNLSSHYHRGCSVSLPCSEWERVVPLRYYHQSPMPDWQFDASHRKVRDRVSGDKPSKNNRFSDIYIQDPPSPALRHGKSNPTRLRFN